MSLWMTVPLGFATKERCVAMIATQRQSDLSLRRAAILLSNLDAETRRRLLAHLPSNEASRLRAAAAALVDVDPLEVRRVVDSFVGRVSKETVSKVGERKDAGSSDSGHPQELPNGDVATKDEKTDGKAGPARVLQFLSEVSDQTLLRVIRSEHPQTVAIVLGALSASQAAVLLRELPSEVRASAIRRLGRLEEVPQDVLSEIGDHLRRVIGEIEPVSNGDGRRSLTSILELLGEEERKGWLRDVAETDGLVASALESVIRAVQPVGKELANVNSSAANSLAQIESTVAMEEPTEQVIIPLHRVDDGHEKEASANGNELDVHDEVLRQIDSVYSADESSQADRILEGLKPKDLQAILARMETRQAILTLCGLSSGQVKRLLKCLPRRQVREVQQRMNGIGSLELREIDEAKAIAASFVHGEAVSAKQELRRAA